jgi:hypothetical protein
MKSYNKQDAPPAFLPLPPSCLPSSCVRQEFPECPALCWPGVGGLAEAVQPGAAHAPVTVEVDASGFGLQADPRGEPPSCITEGGGVLTRLNMPLASALNLFAAPLCVLSCSGGTSAPVSSGHRFWLAGTERLSSPLTGSVCARSRLRRSSRTGAQSAGGTNSRTKAGRRRALGCAGLPLHSGPEDAAVPA